MHGPNTKYAVCELLWVNCNILFSRQYQRVAIDINYGNISFSSADGEKFIFTQFNYCTVQTIWRLSLIPYDVFHCFQKVLSICLKIVAPSLQM